MSTEGFDFEQSPDLSLKYDTQSSVMSDLFGGAVATVADFGASVFNSIVPESMETSTEALLSKIDDNALRVYNENPDTVHTASFIGGVFLPAGAAMKGMTMMRDGSKAVNWFTTAGKTAKEAEIATLFAEGAASTAKYRSAVGDLKKMTWGNAAADAVAAEAAIVMAMNDHPFMEDYMKDPGKNFLQGVAIGTGLVGGIGHILTKSQIRGITAPIQEEAEAVLRSGYKDPSEVMGVSNKLFSMQTNIENWEGILQSAAKTADGIGPVREINDFTKNLLEMMITKEKAAIVDVFDEAASPAIRALAPEVKADLIGLMTEGRMLGVDKIDFVTAIEDLPQNVGKVRGLVESTILKPLGITKKGLEQETLVKELEVPMFDKTKKGAEHAQTMIYSREFNSFMVASDLKHFGTAADITNANDLLKGVENNWHMLPRYDSVLENSRRSSAAVDADYLKALKYYDELDLKKFTNGEIAVSPDDIASLQAIQSRIQKEAQINPDILNSIKVKITKEVPKFDEAGQKIIETVITNTITRTVTKGQEGGTFSKNALLDMTQTIRKGVARFDLMGSSNSLSDGARQLAWAFSGTTDKGNQAVGGMHLLRRGMDAFRRGDKDPQRLLTEAEAAVYGTDSYKALRAKGMSHAQAMERVGDEPSKLRQYADELFNSKESKALRAELKKHADSEGYIFLYRGMRGKAKGHRPGESYTPDYKVALSFAGNDPAGVSLYKVHLDEVIGNLGRYAGSKVGGEAEIVLDVPTRLVAGKLKPIEGTTSSGHTVTEVMSGQEMKKIVKEVSSKEESFVGADKIFDQMLTMKQSEAIEMLQNGVPMETISLHLNLPLDTVKAFAAQGGTDLLSAGAITRYSNAAEIPNYLGVDKKSLLLKANVDRAPIARMKANLQSRTADIADSEVRAVMLNASPSEIARNVGEYLTSNDIRYQMDVLRKNMDKIVSSKIGSKFFTSSDFALRHLEEYGAIIASVGKDVQRLVNNNFERLLNPMKGHLNSIMKDEAALIEFNLANQINAGLRGYREFKDGKFFVQNADTPWIEVKNAQGKVVGKQRNMQEVMYEGRVFEVKTQSVKDALTEIGNAGRELYSLRNTNNKLIGRSPVNDIGFWMPPASPKGKFVGYVYDKVEDSTMMIVGKTMEERDAIKNAYMSKLNPADIGRRFEFIDDKIDQEMFNKLRGRHDPVFMQSADSSMLHGGSSRQAMTPTNADVLSDLVTSYENYIGYAVRSILDSSFSDVMRRFDDISFMSQKGFEKQPLNLIQKYIQKPSDPGAILKNTMMGVSDLKDYGAWQSVSNMTNLGFEYAIKAISKAAEPILDQGYKILGKGKSASDEAYIKLTEDLRNRGIPNPFEGLDDFMAKNLYHTNKISDAPNMTPRILAMSNGLAATVMLKFGELAQPLVNAISLPILTSAAMGRKLQNSFMGAALDPRAKFGLAETMYSGVRFGGSPEGQKLVKRAEELGLFKPIVSEATEALSQSRMLQPGVISTVEKALHSKFVETMSKPADLSETLVRKVAFQTGAYMAKQAYPGITDSGIMIFARDFMDQVIGNYHAAQRPVMFQGTLGVAAGLFQTYMLTTAQQIYRRIETRDWKALAKMMLTQQSIFGARSLPGFNIVSEYIGDNFSDQNMDLTTGTYRALPDGLADLVIYGLPSNLGPGITTRGEIQPRIPNLMTEGINAIPAINILGQAFKSADKVASAAFTADASTGRAVLEAISMQSISRPVARISELITGKSLTQSGNVMYDVNAFNSEGEFQYRAILSRLMATRPVEEIKMREAYYLDKMYGSLDREARKETTGKLKTYLRDGNLDSEKLSDLAEEYFRKGGTATGWRSVINKAIAQTNQPATTTVRNLLSPNSPLQMMIDDLE